MLKWFGSLKVKDSADGQNKTDGITDDPLATIGFNRQQKQIYSVSRINPLYSEDNKCQQFRSSSHVVSKCAKSGHTSKQSVPSFSKKSTSSGYGGSQAGSSSYKNNLKLREDAVAILEQNGNYVKSIKVSISDRNKKRLSRISSHISGSSATGTLTTIPEGRVDFTIPKPIWPKLDLQQETYDSLVDEAMLLYTDLNYKSCCDNNIEEKSIKDILIELLNRINTPMQDTNSTIEEKLKSINKTILLSIEALKNSTEEEIKKLCLNMSNSKNVLSVLRAFGNFSSNSISGNSSESSPEWISEKDHVRTSEAEDFYQIPSGSSSSGFSDSLKQFDINRLPVFVHEDLSNLSDKVKNAMIYGTLYRGNYKLPTEKCVNKENCVTKPRKGLLQACNDNKPSVWEQYYGVTVIPEGISVTYSSNPADVPIYPGGRPEADFTLDVPRSEFLAKRLKADKKWRCRCRLLTSFFGLVFFLLSVMAVSLLLTRGKRMFGSMV